MMEMDADIKASKASTEISGTAAVLSSTTSVDSIKCAEEAIPSVASHKCVFCSQMFDTKLALQDHFRRHANGEIDIKGMLKVKQRQTESKDDCKAEDKTVYISEGQPRARFETAVCDICNEVFRSTSSAITHKFRKHPESVEKHYCPHCGMMFPIKANRDKHISSHGTSTKPNQVFPCLPCKVAFYNERARSFHIESAHKGALRLVNPIQTPAPSLKIVVNNAGEVHSIYYCHLCGCEYQVKYNLQKHLISRHTEEERNATPQAVVQCSMCSALFYSDRAYAAHSLHHRQQDLYATSETMRQHVVQRIDQDFDLRRVPTPLEKIVSSSAIRQNRSETWKSIRAANKKGIGRKSETSVSEYFENNLGTEKISKILQNDSNIEEEINKNVDLKDSNQNIFSESSDNDGTKNTAGHADNSEGLDTCGDPFSTESSTVHQKKTETISYNEDNNDSESEELEVEKIVGMRKALDGGREYLVRWLGFEPADDTWEKEHFLNCPLLVQQFLSENKKRVGPSDVDSVECYTNLGYKKRKT